MTSGRKRALQRWMAELTRMELIEAADAMQRDVEAMHEADAADNEDSPCCHGCMRCLPDAGVW